MPDGDAAVLLALDEQRVEDRAAVVDGDVAHDAHLARVEVDLDGGDVGPERERGVALVELALGGEHAERAAVTVAEDLGRRLGGPAGELAPRQRAGRHAGHADGRRVDVDDDVGDVGLEQVGGQPLGLLDEGLGRLVHGRPAELQRARAAGAAALGDEVGVAVDEADLLHRDAGLVVDEHGERRLVALPVGERAGPHGGRAVVVDLDGAELAGPAAGGDLDVGGDADAERDAVAPLAPGRLVLAQLGVPDGLGGRVERRVVARRCRR